jgi:putative spermidine/putrescine transport system permease protein
MQEPRDTRGWLVTPAALILGIFFIYPVASLLLMSITSPQFGLQNFAALVHAPVYLKALLNTVIISGSVTLTCMLLAYPIAYTMANSSATVRRLLVFAVLVPFWSSILVRTFAWMVLLQKRGLINKILIDYLGILQEPLALIYNRTGVVVGMSHVLLPFIILPLYSVLSRIDPNLSKAASSLGAPPVRNFFRVYLPLSLPGLLSGGLLVFVIALGYYVTPTLLGGPGDTMIAQLIEMQVADFGNFGVAASLSVVLLVGTMSALVFVNRSLIAGPE